MRGVFCTICSSISLKERSRQALDRLPLVSNFLTNFWMEHFDGARLSGNSVRNAVWQVLNEPVCHYLRTRNPRCSTVYIDNSLGPLARDSLYIFGVCNCRLIYPSCSAHSPYCHLWPVALYNIFPHYLINGTIIEEKLLHIKCLFWFSLKLSPTFLTLRTIKRDMIKNLYWSSCNVLVILTRFLKKFNVLNRFSKNSKTLKLMKIRPVGDELSHADGQTDRYGEANSRFSQFCKSAQKHY